jgi:hypothetical protein
MQLSFENTIATYRKFALLALCLATCLLFASGCSKPEEKEPQEESKVVHDLNIQTSDNSSTSESATDSTAKAKLSEPADEVESLPFESGDSPSSTAAKDDELPVLGGGT